VGGISHPERRVVVSIDMESYSRRNNRLQHRAQQGFQQIMEEATAETSLNRASWKIQQGGDGELGILPPDTSERAVLGLVPVLDQKLREYNDGLEPGARVRLRIAVHQGLVHLDGANGFPSEAIVGVSRLVDAPQLKQALRAFPGANAALIVSEGIYREVVEQYGDLRADQFVQVTASIPDKDFSAPAWIYVPGEDPGTHPELSGGPPSPSTPSTPPPTPSGSQVFNGIKTYGPAAFGNHNVQHLWGRPDGRGSNDGR
jgi:hypothetical protein